MSIERNLGFLCRTEVCKASDWKSDLGTTVDDLLVAIKSAERIMLDEIDCAITFDSPEEDFVYYVVADCGVIYLHLYQKEPLQDFEARIEKEKAKAAKEEQRERKLFEKLKKKYGE